MADEDHSNFRMTENRRDLVSQLCSSTKSTCLDYLMVGGVWKCAPEKKISLESARRGGAPHVGGPGLTRESDELTTDELSPHSYSDVQTKMKYTIINQASLSADLFTSPIIIKQCSPALVASYLVVWTTRII